MSLQTSNVIDVTETLEDFLMDCVNNSFDNGLELRDGEWVFAYVGESLIPRIWNQTRQDQGDYNLDEILWVPCNVGTGSSQYKNAGKLIKVTGKDGSGIETHQRNLQPEEYGVWDEASKVGMNYGSFKNRYWRVANDNPIKQWVYDSRHYYYYWANGLTWSAKDLTATLVHCPNLYLRTNLGVNATKSYSRASDIKAEVPKWCGPGSPGPRHTYQFKSAILRNGCYYFRTHLNIPAKTATWTTGAFKYSYSTIITPADIPGFKDRRLSKGSLPFDGKSYTKALIDTTHTAGVASWRLLATDEFNSIAFGRINCRTINVRVEDKDGNVLSEINNFFVQNEAGINSDLEYDSTVVLYTTGLMPAESYINITLVGEMVEIGEILGSKSVNAGFTKMQFKSKFIDFSPSEESQWGDWDYLDGNRVKEFSGTVEFPIMEFDSLNRLMLLIGGQTIVVNASDSTLNEAPDGFTVFESTQLIGRITKMELDSSEQYKKIGDIGKYTFTMRSHV